MTDTPQAAFDAYIRAFESLDPKAALPFYHRPCMFIASQGVFPAPDSQTTLALLSQFMEPLKGQSYRRTEVMGLSVRNLSAGLAALSGTFLRFNTRGEEFARVGFTYIMRRADSWQIVVATVHDPSVA